jgi:hypothetical protein
MALIKLYSKLQRTEKQIPLASLLLILIGKGYARQGGRFFMPDFNRLREQGSER